MNERVRANETRTGVIGGAILVALGAIFLAQELLSFDPGRYGWPFFIIGPGLLLFVGMLLGGRGAGGFAVPGSIVTTVGTMLFVQNLTGRFETWAYSWALIPTAVGVGLMIAGHWDGDAKQVREGRGTMLVGLALFLGFGAWFELFIFRGSALTTYAFPVALIVGGLAVVVRNALRARRASAAMFEDVTDGAQGGWSL
jgi:hypothetical protein